jgi:hypothetical protein
MKLKRFFKEDGQLCNICLQPKPLTWDHVPPQGCVNAKGVMITNWLPELTSQKERPLLSQNGVKFRTICRDCNSLMSGGDKALINLSYKVREALESPIKLHRTLTCRTDINLIMRSIIGHLLATKSGVDESVFDEQARKYVLDHSLPIPEEVHIFFWLYPYKEIRINRDLFLPKVRGPFRMFTEEVGCFHVLKFYPFAFLVTNFPDYENMPSLDAYRKIPTGQIEEVIFDLAKIPKGTWPEAIAEDNPFMLLGPTGDEGVVARAN